MGAGGGGDFAGGGDLAAGGADWQPGVQNRLSGPITYRLTSFKAEQANRAQVRSVGPGVSTSAAGMPGPAGLDNMHRLPILLGPHLHLATRLCKGTVRGRVGPQQMQPGLATRHLR